MTKNAMINEFFHEVEVETSMTKDEFIKELRWLALDINREGIDSVMNRIDLDTIATIGKVAAATLSSD